MSKKYTLCAILLILLMVVIDIVLWMDISSGYAMSLFVKPVVAVIMCLLIIYAFKRMK